MDWINFKYGESYTENAFICHKCQLNSFSFSQPHPSKETPLWSSLYDYPMRAGNKMVKEDTTTSWSMYKFLCKEFFTDTSHFLLTFPYFPTVAHAKINWLRGQSFWSDPGKSHWLILRVLSLGLILTLNLKDTECLKIEWLIRLSVQLELCFYF